MEPKEQWLVEVSIHLCQDILCWVTLGKTLAVSVE